MSSERASVAVKWHAPLRPLVIELRPVLIAFVVSRALVFAVILMSRLIMVRAASWHGGGLLSMLEQFDGELWYMSIARHGYFFSTTETSPTPFFPLFPILLRITSFVFHDLRVAAFIEPHACLLVAGILLHYLTKTDYADPSVSRAAVVFLMFSPSAIFFSSAYSESTFLLLATGSFLAAFKRHWLLACILGMCLSATRNVGVLIGVPLFVEYCRQQWTRRGRLSDLFHPRLLLLALVPLGLAAYMLFSYLQFGDALAFVHASKVWGRRFTSPTETITNLGNFAYIHRWVNLGTMLAALILLAAGVWLQLRLSYLAWCVLLTVTYLCASSIEAWPRFLSIEFPLYIAMGLLTARLRWSYEPLIASSIALLVIGTVLSANGYWWT